MLSKRYQILENRLGLLSGIGGEDPKKKPLTYNQINQWSNYVEKNPSRDFGLLWEGFSKLNPKSGIDKSVLKSDLDNLMKVTQQESKKDGAAVWSTAHTGYTFPRVFFNGKDYGRVNASMQTQTPIPTPTDRYPQKLISKEIPVDTKNYWFDEAKGLVAYEDPYDGTIKYAEKEAMRTPELKRKSELIAAAKKPAL